MEGHGQVFTAEKIRLFKSTLEEANSWDEWNRKVIDFAINNDLDRKEALAIARCRVRGPENVAAF